MAFGPLEQKNPLTAAVTAGRFSLIGGMVLLPDFWLCIV
jgi:hypothetical protein